MIEKVRIRASRRHCVNRPPGKGPDSGGQNGNSGYYVIEGEGSFAAGKRRAILGPGAVAWSTPGEPHGVANDSDGNLVLLLAVAPNPNR